MNLTMHELAVLTTITEPMTIHEAAQRAVALVTLRTFDNRVALKTIQNLDKMGLVRRVGIDIVEPTQKGVDSIKDTLWTVRKLEVNFQKCRLS